MKQNLFNILKLIFFFIFYPKFSLLKKFFGKIKFVFGEGNNI